MEEMAVMETEDQMEHKVEIDKEEKMEEWEDKVEEAEMEDKEEWEEWEDKVEEVEMEDKEEWVVYNQAMVYTFSLVQIKEETEE